MMTHGIRGLALLGLLASPALADDAARCQQLMAKYDHYAIWHDDSTPAGYMQRQIGEIECKAGRYASGVADLEMALRMIGFLPTQ